MAGRITVKTKGIKPKGLAKITKQVVSRVLELIAFVLQSELKREAPVGKTGNLRASIQPPTKVGAESYGITIGADYWRPVQFGSKPHTITAKPGSRPNYDIVPVNASILRFEVNGQVVWAHKVSHPNPGYLAFEIGGKVIIRHSVQHPGTKANPFVDRAIDNTEPKLDSVVAMALREVGL